MSTETEDASRVVGETDAPDDWPIETIDVRTLGPPEPMRQTLNRLVDLDEKAVLVQINDRAPQHLYPKLEDRGFVYATVELDDAVGTAIWRAE